MKNNQVSHSFQKNGVAFKHQGQLRHFFWVIEAFPSNEWDAFPKEKTRNFQRNGAICQIHSSWNLPHFEPNDYHCSAGVQFAAVFLCFSLAQASFKISPFMTHDHFRIQHQQPPPKTKNPKSVSDGPIPALMVKNPYWLVVSTYPSEK